MVEPRLSYIVPSRTVDVLSPPPSTKTVAVEYSARARNVNSGNAPHRDIDFSVYVQIRRLRKRPVVGVQVKQRTSLDDEIQPYRAAAPNIVSTPNAQTE
jgi:hypothetical protein